MSCFSPVRVIVIDGLLPVPTVKVTGASSSGEVTPKVVVVLLNTQVTLVNSMRIESYEPEESVPEPRALVAFSTESRSNVWVLLDIKLQPDVDWPAG